MIDFIKTKPLYASLIAGILAGFAFQPFQLPFLLFPAFYIFLVIADESPSAKSAMYRVYPGLLIWNGITTYWLTFATIIGGSAAILANAVVMTFPFALAHRLTLSNDKNRAIYKAFIYSGFWVLFEFAHYHWDLAWPWLTLGNAFADCILIIQYIEYTGVLGISLWVILTASIYHFTNNKSISLIVFLFPMMLSTLIHFQNSVPEDAKKTSLNVTVIQPNYDSYQAMSGFASVEAATLDLLKYTKSNIDNSTDLIVWPENAFEGSHTPYSQMVQQVRDSLMTWKITAFGGITHLKFYSEHEPIPTVVRGRYNGRAYDYMNSAFNWRPDGNLEIYDKAKLVPIVERLPFSEFFSHIDLFNWVEWEDFIGYGKGHLSTPFSVKDSKSAIIICYDSVFPDWIYLYVREGAEFITIITNDGWWGETSGHVQHFSYARLRAIETRKYIVRSANNATSGIINPDGIIEHKTNYWVRTAIQTEIIPNTYQTFYVRFGNWLVWVVFITVIISTLYVRFAFPKKH